MPTQLRAGHARAADPLPCRLLQATSYVSRRRMDAADFDPNEVRGQQGWAWQCMRAGGASGLSQPGPGTLQVDDDGLPLVYNEQKIADYWKGRPGELVSRCACHQQPATGLLLHGPTLQRRGAPSSGRRPP